MTLEVFKDAVKNEGWVIQRKDGYFYFKRRDTSRAYNQGAVYSCHTKEAQQAITVIQEWLLTGFPETKKEKKTVILFNDYLADFWSLEGDYFKSAEYEGRRITKKYILENANFLRLYVFDYFKGVRLASVDEKRLNDFFHWLINQKTVRTHEKLSNSLLYRIKNAVIIPLKIGRQKGIVKQPIDFTFVFSRLSNKAKRNRTILTPEETTKLILHTWASQKAYIAFCIAVNCGLRIGEIRALRIGCIRNGFLIVNKSYNDVDGLKCPKNGQARIVPCPDDVLEIIRKYIDTLPDDEKKDDCFLLTNTFGDKPIESSYCLQNFNKELKRSGIAKERINEFTGEKEYLCFHSLRHQTATRWVESGIDLRLIAKALGHTVKMLEHYSDHLSNDDILGLRQNLIDSHLLGIEKK